MHARGATRLIVNADDFGLTRGVNRAIAELHRAGAVSSATLMANGAAFDDALAIAFAQPSLGVGCHVVLADGAPLSPPDAIPSLLGPAGAGGVPHLRRSLAGFAAATLSGRLREEEIERETEAQITRLLQAGIRPTHVDTHKHTHMFPAVQRAVLRAAERLGVPAVRNPFEPAWAMRLGHGRSTRRLQLRALLALRRSFTAATPLVRGFLQTTDGALGVSTTGTLNRSSLAELLRALPTGTWELVCHPGYRDAALESTTTSLLTEREREREALLALVPTAAAANEALELVSFAALATTGANGTRISQMVQPIAMTSSY